jgi:hypothetical protein
MFNLFEKPSFPDKIDFDQNVDRSVIGLYLK